MTTRQLHWTKDICFIKRLYKVDNLTLKENSEKKTLIFLSMFYFLAYKNLKNGF